MNRAKPIFSVTNGRADAQDRIALSLVHPRERIDIPVKAVCAIEAHAERTFFFSDTLTSQIFQKPRVRLVFAPYIGARIHRLTSQIVGEVLAIKVAGKIVARPLVREPHGFRETFCIGVHDMKEAEALVAKLREAWRAATLRQV